MKRIILSILLVFNILFANSYIFADTYDGQPIKDTNIELAAVSYKNLSIEPGKNIMIFNKNNRNISVKTDGACQYIVYDVNGNLKSVNERIKGTGSVSIQKNASALICNSGVSNLTVRCDERYFNDYTMGYGNVYVDYSLGAGESVKFVNKTNLSGKLTITSLPDTYDYIKYKSFSKLDSGARFNKGKQQMVQKGQTIVITNNSTSNRMTIHYTGAIFDKNNSTPAYNATKVSIGSLCKVSNNTSGSLRIYATNFAGKKRTYTIKANDYKIMRSENFGVYIYTPSGFMTVE